MRILFVTNRFPGQAMRGDQLRAFEQIRHLSQRHAITLLSFEAAHPRHSAGTDLAAWCERVVTLPRRRLLLGPRLAGAMFDPRPIQAAIYDTAAQRRCVDALLADTPFDLVHVQLARLGGLVQHVRGVPCVLDLIDALSLNMARRGALDRGLSGFVARREAARLVDYERVLCAQAAGVAVCSPVDRAAIGDYPNLVRIDNGVDLDRFRFVATADPRPEIVFVGNLGYFPNVDAISWFAANVLPLLSAHVPAVRLVLVGARPAASLQRLARRSPCIDLVGPVADVHPYLSRAAIAVVPLRAGSGQQLKVLEAMATGTPVVATSIAAAGLDAVPGEHLRVADDAASMAAAILDVMHDRAAALRMAGAARRLVEQRHSWRDSALALERLWLQAVGRA